jgi:hypothetical protein
VGWVIVRATWLEALRSHEVVLEAYRDEELDDELENLIHQQTRTHPSVWNISGNLGVFASGAKSQSCFPSRFKSHQVFLRCFIKFGAIPSVVTKLRRTSTLTTL